MKDKFNCWVKDNYGLVVHDRVWKRISKSGKNLLYKKYKKTK